MTEFRFALTFYRPVPGEISPPYQRGEVKVRHSADIDDIIKEHGAEKILRLIVVESASALVELLGKPEEFRRRLEEFNESVDEG